MSGFSRRDVARLGVAGAAGAVGVPVLAACGSEEVSAPEGAPGEVIVPTSEVPVGGGVILDEKKVVVTQPTAGEYKAFSSICTHQGCAVTKVEDEAIVCSCHMSLFAITDGSVVDGPADRALPEVAVAVEGDDVTFA